MSDPNDSTTLSSIFLEFCAKVRNSDPSILPAPGEPFTIRDLSEKEDMELADALLENTNITYLQMGTCLGKYTKSAAEAMAKYVRTSKHLQRICWPKYWNSDDASFQLRQEKSCCFLPAIQKSTSLKELHINFALIAGPSNLALESMLTHTQSLRSLSLIFPSGLEHKAVAAVRSGLKKNTTLRELTLEFSWCATALSPMLTSLRDKPLLQRLCLLGRVLDLTELATVLLSDTSKIMDLEIDRGFQCNERFHNTGLTRVLRALARYPTLTKLGLSGCPLGRDEARRLRAALCNLPSLQSLALTNNTLGSAGLAEIAPALYRNTSIKVLDMSDNDLSNIECARLLREIMRRNKTMTTLDLSGSECGVTGVIECIADGLGGNSTLLKIDLSYCALEDHGVSTLARNLGSRNTTLQKLKLGRNEITSAGVGVILDTVEQSCHHITDLDLKLNPIGDEGASLLARSLRNNTLPNLTRLSLEECEIGDDGFIALVSALEQNTSLLHLDLNFNHGVSEQAILTLAESLPEIKVLQRVDMGWSTGIHSSDMPLLLAGLHKNTSLFRFRVLNCPPYLFPSLTTEETARSARFGRGWMQEMESLGYRNRFLALIRAPKERLPPRGIWPRALARDGILPDVICLRCSVPNPAWCRLKILRKRPTIPTSRRNASAVTSES
jgi:Leucine-rich repeat (LRR) protein